MLLKWQNSPETRRFARDPSAPGAQEHNAWFSRRLADPICTMNMVVIDGDPAGFVRVDAGTFQGKSVMEVSILIAPEWKEQGVGTAALRLTRDQFPDFDLYAEVLPENTASHKLFRVAGFEPLSPQHYVSRGLREAGLGESACEAT